jgi:hypothetical protein
MKKLRKSVFETNSSSTHSLHISSDGMYDTMPIDDNGDAVLHGGQFGWELERFYSPEDKASYLAIYCIEWYPADRVGKKLLLDILVDVIKSQTLCERVIFNFTTDYGSVSDDLMYSYIDHQSVEDKDYHWLFEDTQKLKDFIFGKRSYLETDNDNH